MSSDIQVGDLVCIVKPATCCGYDGTVGEFYIVLEIATTGTSECVHCGDVKMSHDAKLVMMIGLSYQDLKKYLHYQSLNA